MSIFHYPGADIYHTPKKNVLVIGCIDLRLTDNLVAFLQHDNLNNRYDHFALAGASLCASHLKEYPFNKAGKQLGHWKTCLFDHLQIAIDLHDIRDVYIVEHEDCGAYKAFLKEGDFKNYKEEEKCHKAFATSLSHEIHQRKYLRPGKGNAVPAGTPLKKEDPELFQLHVHCFILDIRGNVKLLHTTHPKI